MPISKRKKLPPLLEHLSQNPPKILYHYTSLEVLEKITSTGNLWASDIEFLNDSEEYFNAKAFIKNELEAMVDKNERVRSIVHSQVGQMFHELEHLDVYVASFSTEGDSLPQWRGYCPNGQGVAIGFRPWALSSATIADEQSSHEAHAGMELKLLKCVYTPKEKIKLLHTHLGNFINLVDKHLGTDSIEPGNFLQSLTDLCCPFFKNESFREEMEWRLSVRTAYRDVPQRQFHVGRSILIPHLELNVSKNYKLDFIKELVIGPTPNRDLSFRGVKTLLNSRGLHRVDVRNSAIPYRTW